MRTLKPHQEMCKKVYLKGRKRSALVLDMRLGKTILTIDHFQAMKRVLVVCPFSCLIPWEEELDYAAMPNSIMQAPDWRALDLEYAGSRVSTKNLPEGWYATNYESLRVCPFICDVPWDAVVLDESVLIKNPQAQITKLCINRFKHVENKAILSGLIDPEDRLDVVCQFLFLRGRFCGYRSFWEFREEMYQNVGYDWIPLPGTREVMMAEVAKYAYILTKEDAGLGNERIYEKRYIKLSPIQKRLQKKVNKEWRTEKTSTKWTVVIHNWLQRIAGGFEPGTLDLISDGKLKLLDHIVTGELKREKIVVFFKFNLELKHVAKRLRAKGVSLAIITGATDKDKRKKRIRSLRKKDGIRVLLCQIKCVKYGLNLSAASVGIFFSNGESLNERRQCIERLEHMDKDEPLLFIDLVSQGTIDESIIQNIRMKDSESRFFMKRVQSHFEEMMEVA